MARKPELLGILRRDEHARRALADADAQPWRVAVWPSAGELAALPPSVAVLARERDGWEATAWAGRLLYLAVACESLHPGRAVELRAAAAALAPQENPRPT
jgi:hypothetical protein